MTAGQMTQAQVLLVTFTVSSCTVAVNDKYTSGGFTFQVLVAGSSVTTIQCAGTGSPAASGTLTKVSGASGSTSSITFSAASVSNAYFDPINTSGWEGQPDYSEYAQIGIVGMPYDIAEVADNVSQVAYETIGLGLGLVRMPSYNIPGQFVCRLPKANYNIITMTNNLVASNVVNFTVNGIAVARITCTGTAATDAAAIVTSLLTHPQVASANIVSGTSNMQIAVYSKDGYDCVIANWAVTLGATQTTTAAYTLSTNDLILGVSMQTQGKEQQLGSLILNYLANDVVNVRRVGRIYAFSETACNPNDPVYVRIYGTTTTINSVSYNVVRGGLGNRADSGNCVQVPNWYWWQGTQVVNNGLAVARTA